MYKHICIPCQPAALRLPPVTEVLLVRPAISLAVKLTLYEGTCGWVVEWVGWIKNPTSITEKVAGCCMGFEDMKSKKEKKIDKQHYAIEKILSRMLCVFASIYSRMQLMNCSTHKVFIAKLIKRKSFIWSVDTFLEYLLFVFLLSRGW